jgi:sigma-B regulation protein RsbU (phosphoserine phosphatase)
MLRNRGLALKLIVLILSSITLIFSAVLTYNYFFSRQIITNNIERNANHLTLATVNRIDRVLSAVEKVPQNLAYFLESTAHGRDDIIRLLRAVVQHNSEIYGATIAFEPYSFDPSQLHFAPYVYKCTDGIKLMYIPYEYFYWDWYQIPKELNHPIWSEPYYDEGAGNIIMSTYSVPFYGVVNGERQLKGIVTADISLTWLQQIVSSIKVAKTGYGFLLSKNGTYITHPREDLIMNETIFCVAEERGDLGMRELGRAMIQGKSGFVPVRGMGKGKGWLAYAPLPSSGWSLGTLFPQGELMADIIRLNRTVFFISVVGFLFILAAIIIIGRSITRPLRALSKATEEIGTGNLEIELPPVSSKDEVGSLTESFEQMKRALRQYIQKLTETTAAKERIESELKIARDIQMGILPKTFPPFPERHEFEIYAILEPAKEVGGDLYDFFFIDDDHLCFTVGDVSDKGVPASLFMVITRTLIKTNASQGMRAEVVLNRVNENLSADNPSLMFVTLFLGILNIRTGELEYSNGGHNPPYIIDGQGHTTPLETTNGMALGVVEDFSYGVKRVVLRRGESIFLYTDGVTEATSEQGEFFSVGRLEKELARLKDKHVDEVIAGIMQQVTSFSEGVPQADDITMLILRFWGE